MYICTIFFGILMIIKKKIAEKLIKLEWEP